MRLTELYETFVKADPAYGPVPYWWWSGEEITAERIRWQMRKFRNGGLRNIGIINLAPTGPQYGCAADRPPYASEAWWELFEAAVREAEKLVMRVWFYDQIGFSGSNMPARIVTDNPAYAGYRLRRYSHGERLPEHAEPLFKDSAFVYAAVRQGFNWLDPGATSVLIDRVHGEMERRFPRDLGRTIAGSFQDELPPFPLWTPELPMLYMERFGEDLSALLPALFDPLPGSAPVRRRVYRLAAELAEKSFFIPVGQWHRKHGMVIGCDQAGPAKRADPHGAQRLYLDYFRTHRHYNAPGADMDGEIKPHASMAHLHDGSRVWLEAFHSSGWGGTLEETMHWLIPWLQSGATLYNPHAVYYTTRGGWWEWAPPDTGWRQPYFEHYPVFADTVSRVCSLLSAGRHVCDVAVHYPSYAVCGHLSLTDEKKSSEHPMAVANRDPNEPVTFIHSVYKEVTGSWNRRDHTRPGALRKAHIDFDIVDDSALNKSVPSGEGLRIGEESFSVMLLCGTETMDEEARNKLEEWIRLGGLVVGVAIPEREKELGGVVHVNTAEEAVTLIESLVPKRVEGPGDTLHRRTDDADLFLLLPPQEALLRMHQPASPGWTMTERAVYRLRTGREPRLWDPVTGTIASLDWTREGEWIEVTVPFDSWPAALVVCSEPGAFPEEEVRSVGPRQPRETCFPFAALTGNPPGDGVPLALPEDRWRVKAVPTLDNRYGDFDLHGDDNAFLPIERRMMQVRTELNPVDGEQEGWHLPAYDDSAWSGRIWSESAYWRVCPGDEYKEADARPVVYSNVFGDMAMRSWAGRMGRVPRRYLNLGSIPKGECVCAKTSVIAPAEGAYWLRIESNAAVEGWINGQSMDLEGGPEEQRGLIRLQEGANRLLLRVRSTGKGPVRAGVEINREARPALPKWIYAGDPGPQSALMKRITSATSQPFRSVRIVFAAKGRAALHVNGVRVTEHGDFNPYIRQGQEEVDITGYWRYGVNEVKLTLPEGRGEVFADGIIEHEDGTEISFCTGADWTDEEGREPGIHHAGVLQFAETESLWVTARPHPLPGVGWLMPGSVPETAPLPFVSDPESIGRPVWLRFPLPAGAVSMKIPAAGRMRVWIGGDEAAISGCTVTMPPARAGTLVAVRIEPAGTMTEAAVLHGPVRFETVSAPGPLGDWRTALCLPHHSGAVEYETDFACREDMYEAVLDAGHIRGTAEAWLDGEPLGVRLWKPYRFALAGKLTAGNHRLRIRVTNTLGTHYEVGRPTSLVGGNPDITYWSKDHSDLEEDVQSWFPSCGMHGPVRIIGREKR
ncbi:hypothetical protein AB6A23_06185 [Paenibacillus tarimensis]